MSKWMPIETAPKDGTWVILSGGDTYEEVLFNVKVEESDRPVVAKWADNGWDGGWTFAYWDSEWRSWYEDPTHWMPLPKPPNVGGEA